MKLLSYRIDKIEVDQVGILHNQLVYNLNACFGDKSLVEIVQIKDYQDKIAAFISNKNCKKDDINNIMLLPPVSNPNSFRDAYAFRQHVKTARDNRGAKMLPEFDQFPVFYFSNHNNIYGHKQDVEVMPDHLEQLDYELELAVLIGKGGKNIRSKDADQHIAGFFILNDLSARKLQMEEMRFNLGPAKGKDFASIIGPYLVTPDELEAKSIDTPFGKKYDLKMSCYVNGELLSNGNAQDMHWTFAEIIERASYGVDLFPGDIIGSGTVGTGCLLELNGSRKKENSNYEYQWLNTGDEIELQIEGLGKITNKIIKSKSNHSLLKLKK